MFHSIVFKTAATLLVPFELEGASCERMSLLITVNQSIQRNEPTGDVSEGRRPSPCTSPMRGKDRFGYELMQSQIIRWYHAKL
ncbi:hypothetical protein QBC35DRAFT_227753 [Podospora australis]|uniref:Uncharacterized protein n=1 Tax=Podospora australis TaxID=1536484 RepID=A0AAN6X3G5_9PEZI|nr:hypothetical protein QBC35DRAFT_227753 [Podospora australis]